MTSSHHEAQEFHVPEIRFVGEQDGLPERILKERISDLFRFDSTVNRAYLVKVDFGTQKHVGVVLAIRRQFGADEGLVKKVGAVFASIFDAEEHLDIMFLNDRQEVQLANCCQPFFRSSSMMRRES